MDPDQSQRWISNPGFGTPWSGGFPQTNQKPNTNKLKKLSIYSETPISRAASAEDRVQRLCSRSRIWTDAPASTRTSTCTCREDAWLSSCIKCLRYGESCFKKQVTAKMSILLFAQQIFRVDHHATQTWMTWTSVAESCPDALCFWRKRIISCVSINKSLAWIIVDVSISHLYCRLPASSLLSCWVYGMQTNQLVVFSLVVRPTKCILQ